MNKISAFGLLLAISLASSLAHAALIIQPAYPTPSPYYQPVTAHIDAVEVSGRIAKAYLSNSNAEKCYISFGEAGKFFLYPATKTFSLRYTSPGTFTIVYECYGASGGYSSFSQTVTISNPYEQQYPYPTYTPSYSPYPTSTPAYTPYPTYTPQPQTPYPFARFTFSPQYPRVGEAITFDCSSSYDRDGISRCMWDFYGQGRHVSEYSLRHTHVFDRAGTYSFSVTVYDSLGYSSQATGSVTVYGPQPTYTPYPSPTPYPTATYPVVRFTFSPQYPRVGEAITFDCSSSYDRDGISRCMLDFYGQGRHVSEYSLQRTHVFDSSGTYSFIVTVYDNLGYLSQATGYVTVYGPQPTYTPTTPYPTPAPYQPVSARISRVDVSGRTATAYLSNYNADRCYISFGESGSFFLYPSAASYSYRYLNPGTFTITYECYVEAMEDMPMITAL